MVQALLRYENPKVVAGSILKMENDDVMRLSCDAAGSHMIDAFLTSPTVTSVKKTKLITKIKVHIQSCIHALVKIDVHTCTCMHVYTHVRIVYKCANGSSFMYTHSHTLFLCAKTSTAAV